METGSYFDLLFLVNLVLKSGNDCRVKRFNDTAVAYLTVLIAPVRVVVVRAREVIYLLRYGCILATLCRSTEGDQFEALVVPDTLCGQEITERLVLDTFANDALVIDIR